MRRKARQTRHVTPSLIAALKVSDGEQRVYDSDVRGFGVRVHNGRKSFFVYAGKREQRQHVTLGDAGGADFPIVQEARARAREIKRRIEAGEDVKAPAPAEKGAETFAELMADFVKVQERRKRRSIKQIEVYLRKAADLFGEKAAASVSRGDVRRFYNHVLAHGAASPPDMHRGTWGANQAAAQARRNAKRGPFPITANRALTALSSCLAWAEDEERIPRNVARRLEREPEKPRDRVLTDEELGRVVAAVRGLEDEAHRAALLLLVLTGARSGEVAKARWADISFEDKTWRFPLPKSGRRGELIPLGPSALAVLQGLPRRGEFLFPGRKPEQHISNLKRVWDRVCKAAGVTGATLHDLRRTYGLAAARVAGLHVASKLLRHSSVKITEQAYAPLGLAELLKAADKVDEVTSAKLIAFEKKVAG